MFKNAYVRGVANALINGGHVLFPDEISAAKIADFIAPRVAFEPQNGQVSKEATAKIAEAIVDASNYLKKQPGFKAASFSKVASVEDLGKLAYAHAMDLMQKAAEGSNIEGGDKGNTEMSSAEAKMDASARPGGYAENSLGKTDVDTKPGAVGKEQDQPNKPAESPAGSNSVVEQSRTASLADLIARAKVAEGSTIMGGDKGNKEPTTAEGKMDMGQRPAGYAVLPSQGSLGELMKQYGSSSAVGKETTHPNGPSESPSGSNSLTETSAKSAEDAFMVVFKKTAAEIAPHLPISLHEEAKIAHVRACMGMNTEEKAHYLTGLQKNAADKTASGTAAPKHEHYNGRTANQAAKVAEMPAFIQEKIDAKKNEGSEKKDDDKKDDGDKKDANPFAKKDDDKDEKKDDEKSAQLRDTFRRINASLKA